MTRASFAFTTVLTFAALLSLARSQAQQSDPVSIIDTLFQARDSADYDLALALFADEAVVVDVVGQKFIGRDDIKRFLQSADAQGRAYEIEGVRAASGVVTWTEAITSPDYEKLEIAPVQIAKEAAIRDGKINLLVGHFPPSSLAKFEKACEQQGCETPKADGMLFFGQPCLKFLRSAWARTRWILSLASSSF